ncbi:hypothetical protein NCCP28_00530 [Niallia sp. NCCP-28]|nr:hypothetical protein NCCP28_00530 [Niallia sp. NCCP-28]
MFEWVIIGGGIQGVTLAALCRVWLSNNIKSITMGSGFICYRCFS